MQNFDIIGLVKSMLDNGYTVCYVDSDLKRVRDITNRLRALPENKLSIRRPELTAEGTVHYNVLVTVNEDKWDESVRKEINNIAGFVAARYPVWIRVGV